MTAQEILLVLGDEHVHPVVAVWSAAASDAPATRATPQRCTSRESAMELASQHSRTASQTRNYPWIRDANGLVLSPAYQRGYAKSVRF